MSTRPMRLHIYRCSWAESQRAPDGLLSFVGRRHGWRWRIKAGNGRILASGEAYTRLIDCAHGAGLVVGFDLYGIKPGDDFRASRATAYAHTNWHVVVDK